jgi:hypothetical protein
VEYLGWLHYCIVRTVIIVVQVVRTKWVASTIGVTMDVKIPLPRFRNWYFHPFARNIGRNSSTSGPKLRTSGIAIVQPRTGSRGCCLHQSNSTLSGDRNPPGYSAITVDLDAISGPVAIPKSVIGYINGLECMRIRY